MTIFRSYVKLPEGNAAKEQTESSLELGFSECTLERPRFSQPAGPAASKESRLYKAPKILGIHGGKVNVTRKAP